MDLGFEYRKKNRTRALIEREDLVLKRIHFLRNYVKNMRANPVEKLEELFRDENWNFQHGQGKGKAWQARAK